MNGPKRPITFWILLIPRKRSRQANMHVRRGGTEEIGARRHLPIVVGGTGLYLRALLDGLFPGPERSEDLRERLRESAAHRGSAYLHGISASG